MINFLLAGLVAGVSCAALRIIYHGAVMRRDMKKEEEQERFSIEMRELHISILETLKQILERK